MVFRIFFSVFIVGVIWTHRLNADQPKGKLIIEEGFESGKLPFHISGNSPEVIQVPDARKGQYVMKSELNPKSKIRKRTEVAVSDKIVNFDIGKEYWVGISIKLGEEFRENSKFNDQGMILQWHYRDKLHPEVRDAQPLLLRYQNRQIQVHNEVLKKFMATVPPDYGKWVDWVIHVKFDDKNGIIQVWRNGKKIVDWQGDNHQAEKKEGAYLKFGLYSYQYEKAPPKTDFRRIVYHDELRIAGADGNYDLVAPRDENPDLKKGSSNAPQK